MTPATQRAIELLKQLIATPSHTRDEGATADLLASFLEREGVTVERIHNNLIARSEGFDPARDTLLLNSHHDTVRPSASYTRDPYAPTIVDGRLYGLGANDAGASLVALVELFLTLRTAPLPFNLMLLLSAEEECGGEKGIRAVMPLYGEQITMAIVGEPTSMQAAVAERGLVVLDCVAKGISGHAARGEGVNALYIALDDIARLRDFRLERESEVLGPIHLTTTMISAGTQHNVVPDECRFVVDIRTTDAYTNEETVEVLRKALQSELTPRSTRIRASVIAEEHPLVQAALKAGAATFVSPTTSDRTLMPFPALKIGPGDSSRSHTADEFVLLREIEQGLQTYLTIIENLATEYGNQTLG
ncbi:MAG: M20 family metallo-hydrolase [Alistipes sp.]|nr:M20 family metallo-hydrolase [Alistipes sp.]